MTSQHDALIAREQGAMFQNYRRLPIVVDRAEGCRIYDVDGTSYLDMLGGIAVNALGHAHPRIIEAIQEQASKYLHLSNFFYQEPQIKLAELLREASGYDRVFFTNSGTESTDGAMKLARRHGHQRGALNIVGFTGGFHGRTYGALSIMDKPLYRDGMGPFLPHTMVLPYNDVDALKEHLGADTCAVMLEFIQGEGGISEATQPFVDALWELKQEHGFLIIADEVQAGIGRTGTFFSFERYGVRPDIVTVAKSMGGGLPLGAILANDEVAAHFDKGTHGTTYGGNPLACAAGAVVINEVMGGLMTHVAEIGTYLQERLSSVVSRPSTEHKPQTTDDRPQTTEDRPQTTDDRPQTMYELRGRGCIQGIVLPYDATETVVALRNKHIIANATATNVVRLVPPYVIQRSDVDEFVTAFREILAERTP